jgi:spore coat polysaccharide biosynthesis protein SpsF (cytidylyltransferase family)
MGSTRLPGKVLRDLHGASMLARVVRRVQRATMLDQVVVATSTAPADDAIVVECIKLGVASSRGSEQDVLDRYYQAAREHDADVVVRITSDCPLIEPTIVDTCVSALRESGVDYASNVIRRSYPRGLDVEAMTFAALERIWREADEDYQCAHVTPYIHQHPALFTMVDVIAEANYSQLRWTVDTPEDWQFASAVYARFADDSFSWHDVLALLQREPELTALNAHIEQKELQQG